MPAGPKRQCGKCLLHPIGNGVIACCTQKQIISRPLNSPNSLSSQLVSSPSLYGNHTSQFSPLSSQLVSSPSSYGNHTSQFSPLSSQLVSSPSSYGNHASQFSPLSSQLVSSPSSYGNHTSQFSPLSSQLVSSPSSYGNHTSQFSPLSSQLDKFSTLSEFNSNLSFPICKVTKKLSDHQNLGFCTV